MSLDSHGRHIAASGKRPRMVVQTGAAKTGKPGWPCSRAFPALILGF
jgi:hypothetical protein